MSLHPRQGNGCGSFSTRSSEPVMFCRPYMYFNLNVVIYLITCLRVGVELFVFSMIG